MHDFIYNVWFFYNGYAGNGRKKNPKNIYTRKTRKNSPFGFPPIPPSIKLEADCFPGRKNRKQAGPTLGGAGIAQCSLPYNTKLKLVDIIKYFHLLTSRQSRSMQWNIPLVHNGMPQGAINSSRSSIVN